MSWLVNFAWLRLCFLGICKSGRVIFLGTSSNILPILNSIIHCPVSLQYCFRGLRGPIQAFSSNRLSLREQNESTSSLDTRNCLLPNSSREHCHQPDSRHAFKSQFSRINKSLFCPMSEENICTAKLKIPVTPNQSSVRFELQANRSCPSSATHLPKFLVLWVPVCLYTE